MPPITNALPDLDRTLAFFPAETVEPKALTVAQINDYNESGYISPDRYIFGQRGCGQPRGI